MDEKILVECKKLQKFFNTPRGLLHAVDDVSFKIPREKTLGVVGESGCGKSTLGRTILNLLKATSGEVLFDGVNIAGKSDKEMLPYRAKMQMIFQDPYSSIDPRMTISQIIEEPFVINKVLKQRKERQDRVRELMEIVGLDAFYVNAYPHELDGGRRQRIGVARALALNPEFIVCDEPVSALDVSIQAQILNLLMDLKDERKLTYMFITHDLSVVKHISNNILVLYLGKMVEMAPSDLIFDNPVHPYTKALFSAIPIPDIAYRHKELQVIKGEVTSPINPPDGCRFAPRCPFVKDGCGQAAPEFRETEPGHFVACHLYN
ncbi:MAG: ATP-binding cassette domain-containing protein [Gracilibacteraceae bacterium]|nr:ATP-binding cassette domain-containing protein [Gracilibacteraceae bacterium]